MANKDAKESLSHAIRVCLSISGTRRFVITSFSLTIGMMPTCNNDCMVSFKVLRMTGSRKSASDARIWEHWRWYWAKSISYSDCKPLCPAAAHVFSSKSTSWPTWPPKCDCKANVIIFLNEQSRLRTCIEPDRRYWRCSIIFPMVTDPLETITTRTPCVWSIAIWKIHKQS